MIPSNTLATSVLYDSNLKGVRKPREPRWKAITGGTLPYRRGKKKLSVNISAQYKHCITFIITMHISKISRCTSLKSFPLRSNTSKECEISLDIVINQLPGRERRRRAASHRHPDRWSGLCSQKYHHNLQVDKKYKHKTLLLHLFLQFNSNLSHITVTFSLPG